MLTFPLFSHKMLILDHPLLMRTLIRNSTQVPGSQRKPSSRWKKNLGAVCWYPPHCLPPPLLFLCLCLCLLIWEPSWWKFWKIKAHWIWAWELPWVSQVWAQGITWPRELTWVQGNWVQGLLSVQQLICNCWWQWESAYWKLIWNPYPSKDYW